MNHEISQNVGLVGFMGSGKSVVGRALARELQFGFIDTDVIIEERTGELIHDIFNSRGEEYFRQIEREVVQEVCKTKSHVISFGGGVVLSPTSVQIIRNSSTVILLTASLESIMTRIGPTSHRPLLSDNDINLKEMIENLLEQRKAHYTNAMDFEINTDVKSITEIVKEISGRLQY
jgi:shikimate kinase